MAGLIREQVPPDMAEQQGMEEEQAAPEGEGGESNVAPEEQAQYDQFVKNGMQLMYDEKATDQLLENISSSENKVEGLANALVTIVSRLEESATESGQEISGDVMMHGGQELMEQLVELVEEAGIHDYTPEEMESAFLAAIDAYRSMKQEQGTLPVEDLGQDFAELQQAESEGRLEEIAPGATEFAQKAGQGAEQAPPQQSRGLMRPSA